jgi:hypothetical protein
MTDPHGADRQHSRGEVAGRLEVKTSTRGHPDARVVTGFRDEAVNRDMDGGRWSVQCEAVEERGKVESMFLTLKMDGPGKDSGDVTIKWGGEHFDFSTAKVTIIGAYTDLVQIRWDKGAETASNKTDGIRIAPGSFLSIRPERR